MRTRLLRYSKRPASFSRRDRKSGQGTAGFVGAIFRTRQGSGLCGLLICFALSGLILFVAVFSQGDALGCIVFAPLGLVDFLKFVLRQPP